MNAGRIRTSANPPTRPVMPTWHVDWWAATIAAATPEAQERVVQVLTARVGAAVTGAPHGTGQWAKTIGRHGYHSAITLRDWPGVTVQWEGTPEQGVHLSISGQPLAALRARSGECTGCWVDMKALDGIMDECGQTWGLSRLDIACDNEILTPAGVLMQKATGGLVTRLAKVREHSEAGRGQGTVYLGSRESEVFVRVYDKADEQSQGDDVTRRALAPWYRLEVEAHDERANRVLDAWRKHGHRGIMGEVDRVLSFRNLGGDTNVSRRDCQDWWLGLMKGEPRREPVVPKRPTDASLDLRLTWATAHVGGLLAQVADERGYDAARAWLDESIAAGAAAYRLKKARTA